MWKRKREPGGNDEAEQFLADRFRDRIFQISARETATGTRGPLPWSIGMGQTEFVGRSGTGRFAGDFIVVEVQGTSTQDPARIQSPQWLELEPSDILRQVTGYWLTVLRFDWDAPFRGSSEDEFNFKTYNELTSFLELLDIEWLTASDSLFHVEHAGWSPDWLG